jgi:hypothetical protein
VRALRVTAAPPARAALVPEAARPGSAVPEAARPGSAVPEAARPGSAVPVGVAGGVVGGGVAGGVVGLGVAGGVVGAGVTGEAGSGSDAVQVKRAVASWPCGALSGTANVNRSETLPFGCVRDSTGRPEAASW